LKFFNVYLLIDYSIVFVHGLQGHPLNTWSCTKPQCASVPRIPSPSPKPNKRKKVLEIAKKAVGIRKKPTAPPVDTKDVGNNPVSGKLLKIYDETPMVILQPHSFNGNSLALHESSAKDWL
jgi:hypothetical protein